MAVMGKIIACLWLAAAMLPAQQAASAAERDTLTVFAAASLTDTLQAISDAYTRSSGMPVRLSFAASSALARQIEAGARADVFLSADEDWIDYLERKRLIDTREDLLGNRLVLIAPRESATSIALKQDGALLRSRLLQALGPRGRLAVADPDAVPAGKYAMAALRHLQVWEALAPRLVRTENVRVALSYVAKGETPLGIVYATDAAIEPQVRVIAVFPEASHAPIVYPVATTRTASVSSQDYLAFLRSEEAQRIFAQAGFRVLRKTTRAPATASAR